MGNFVIKINDLRIDGFVGIYDYEQNRKTRLLINLTVKTKPLNKVNIFKDDINSTLDYEDLCNFMKDFFNTKRFGLLEHAVLALVQDIVVRYSHIISSFELCITKVSAILDANGITVCHQWSDL